MFAYFGYKWTRAFRDGYNIEEGTRGGGGKIYSFIQLALSFIHD